MEFKSMNFYTFTKIIYAICMVNRLIKIEDLISPKRVLIIYGPRRVGKTTLLRNFLSNTKLKCKFDTGENIRLKALFDSGNIEQLKEYASGYELIAIDEAQAIPHIGAGLKMMVDSIPGLHIIVTGSSSFELRQKTGEPLTGRKRTVVLYPFSLAELLNKYNHSELKEKLEELLIFGSYPEVVTAKTKKEKIFILKELCDSYILKDVFSLERLRAPMQLVKLLKILALQAGSEVSLNKLASDIGLDVKTIIRYTELLENGFIIRRVGSYSGNLRKEITSKAKYYFYDNGIRNALISQFQNLNERNDTGALFENFMMMERIKNNDYKSRNANVFFWRTHDGSEVDLVESRNGKLKAIEFKWNKKNRECAPRQWRETYPNASFQVLDRNNFMKIIE